LRSPASNLCLSTNPTLVCQFSRNATAATRRVQTVRSAFEAIILNGDT
jgi:hypothetical protein